MLAGIQCDMLCKTITDVLFENVVIKAGGFTIQWPLKASFTVVLILSLNDEGFIFIYHTLRKQRESNMTLFLKKRLKY